MSILPPDSCVVAAGEGWNLNHIQCHARIGQAAFEEQHDRHLMAVVLEGTFTYHGEHGRTLLHNGAILLGHQNSCYACGHHHSDGDRCLALQIDDDLLSEIANAMAGSVKFRFPDSSIAVCKSLLPATSALAGCLMAKDIAHTEETVLSFIACMLRHLAGVGRRSSTLLADEARIERVLKYIEDNSHEPLDLGRMAQVSGLSRFHFLRLFKHVTGSTPYQHVVALRLRKAAHSLSATRGGIAETAFECGFGDLSTFNKTFKTAYGVSPGAYRRLGLQ